MDTDSPEANPRCPPFSDPSRRCVAMSGDPRRSPFVAPLHPIGPPIILHTKVLITEYAYETARLLSLPPGSGRGVFARPARSRRLGGFAADGSSFGGVRRLS